MQKSFSLGLVGVVVAILFASALQGCATGAKFTPGAPMNVDRPNMGNERVFIQNNQVLKRGEAVDALEAVPQAKDAVSSMEAYEAGAFVSGLAGAVMFGYGLGTVLNDNVNDQPILIGTGVAAIVLSAIFDNSAAKKAREAVDAYNQSVQSSGGNSTPTKPALPQKTRSELKLTPAGLAWVF